MRNRPPAAVLAVPALVLAALSLPVGVAAARAVSVGPLPDGHISVGTAPAPAAGIPAGGVVLKVSPGGAADGAQFASVQAAVLAVPDNSATPYVIAISRGTYRERVTIPASKRHLTLLGATGSPRDVIITATDYNQEVNPATGTP
jgi:pectin methylesterase-like acyl-CoA thioesterase